MDDEGSTTAAPAGDDVAAIASTNADKGYDGDSSTPPACAGAGAEAMLGGADIAEILRSNGPVVKCVLLRCRPKDGYDSNGADAGASAEGGGVINGDGISLTSTSSRSSKKKVLSDMIDEIEVDTTPNKSMVQQILGGPVTFLGQYPEERTVLMIRVFPPSIEEIVEHFANDDDDEEDEDDNNKDLKTPHAKDILQEMTVSQLRNLCSDRGIDTSAIVKKRNLVDELLKYDESLPPYNPNHLQPPLHKKRVRGDIIVMRVADTEEDLDDDDDDFDDKDDGNKNIESDQTHVSSNLAEKGGEEGEDEDSDGDKKPAAVENAEIDGEAAVAVPHPSDVHKPMNNEEFFQDYTKNEYVAFASRTDIEEYFVDDDEEVDDDDDKGDGEHANFQQGEEELDDEDRNAMFNMVMNEVLRQYREDTGRGPNTQELLDMRANIARELGVEIANVEDGDWSRKAKGDAPSSGKKIAFDDKDRVKEFVPHENEHNYEHNDDDDDDDEEEEDEDYVEDPGLKDDQGDDGTDEEKDDDAEPPTKKLKTE